MNSKFTPLICSDDNKYNGKYTKHKEDKEVISGMQSQEYWNWKQQCISVTATCDNLCKYQYNSLKQRFILHISSLCTDGLSFVLFQELDAHHHHPLPLNVLQDTKHCRLDLEYVSR